MRIGRASCLYGTTPARNTRRIIADMKEANSSAVASADNQGAKTNFDVYLHCCWLVRRIPSLGQRQGTDNACSVCLCSIIRLIVLSRLEDVDLTCKYLIAIPRTSEKRTDGYARELRECWYLDCY